MPTKPPRHTQPPRPKHRVPYARPEQLAALYNSARWQRMRTMYRNEHPLCEDPYQLHAQANRVEPATAVHHRIPLRVDMSQALEPSNLMSVCDACHARLDAELRRATAQGKPVSATTNTHGSL